MSKHPDKELTQAIEIIFASNEMSGAWPDATNDLIDLFTKAQLQLVDELMEQKQEYELTDIEMLEYHGETPLVAIPLKVLQQYKANLSGKGE